MKSQWTTFDTIAVTLQFFAIAIFPYHPFLTLWIFAFFAFG